MRQDGRYKQEEEKSNVLRWHDRASSPRPSKKTDAGDLLMYVILYARFNLGAFSAEGIGWPEYMTSAIWWVVVDFCPWHAPPPTFL